MSQQTKKQGIKVQPEKLDKNPEAKIDEKEKKQEIKKEEKVIKDKAIVRVSSLAISPKSSYSICNMIRGKSIERSIEYLEKVILMKKAVPMNNREIPHRKGNIMAGRYPLNSAREFINLLKQLKANVSVNNIENAIISVAIANRGSRPYKRRGKRAKRTNVYLEARTKNKEAKK